MFPYRPILASVYSLPRPIARAFHATQGAIHVRRTIHGAANSCSEGTIHKQSLRLVPRHLPLHKGGFWSARRAFPLRERWSRRDRMRWEKQKILRRRIFLNMPAGHISYPAGIYHTPKAYITREADITLRSNISPRSRLIPDRSRALSTPSCRECSIPRRCPRARCSKAASGAPDRGSRCCRSCLSCCCAPPCG